jgi:hypothetical protein
MNLVKNTPQMLSIAQDLSSMHFDCCPVDSLHTIYKSLRRLGKMAQENERQRKYGGFSEMITEKPNEVRMMSLDDTLSLFFTILATDPPANAVGLWHWFEEADGLPISGALKNAMATYVAAVQHILGFTEDMVDHDALEDPLGIL